MRVELSCVCLINPSGYHVQRPQVLVPFARGTQVARSTRSSSYKIQKTRTTSTIHDDCLSIAEAAAAANDDDGPLLLDARLEHAASSSSSASTAAVAPRLGEVAPRAIMRGQAIFDERYVGDAAAARRLEVLRAGSLKRPFFDE